MTRPQRFGRDSEREAYLVFHEQGREGLREQFPRAADALLRSWGESGLIVTDQYGERAVRAEAVAIREGLQATLDGRDRVERVRDLHRPGRRPAPRDLD